MRQKKKTAPKERNYSVWFTGIILILVYMILLDNTSKTEKNACKGILKAQIQAAAEHALELSQEKEEEAAPDSEEPQDMELQQQEEVSMEEQMAVWEQEGEEIVRRFQLVDWGQIDPQPLTLDPIEEQGIIYLASIPEEGIYLYGYNDEEYQGRGVAVEFKTLEGSRYFYYDWGYLTPRLVMPEIFWNEKDRQLYISLYVGSGTGFALEELHILQCSDTEPPVDFEFMREDYIRQLEERFSCTVDTEKDELILYDKGQQILKTARSKWGSGEEKILGIAGGDIVHFELGEEIKLIIPLAFKNDRWAQSLHLYNGKADCFVLYINIEKRLETTPFGEQQMVFTLGDAVIETEE